MARMVATKAALSIRVDALSDPDDKSVVDAQAIGTAHRLKLESRLRALEYQADGTAVQRFGASGHKQQQKYEPKGETKTYNTSADAVDLVTTQRESPMDIAIKAVLDVKEEKRRAKEERRSKRKAEKSKANDGDDSADDAMDVDGEKPKKDKKRKRRESEAVVETLAADVEMVCCTLRPEIITDCRSRRRPRKSARHGRRHARQRKRPLLLLPPLRMGTQYRRKRRKSLRHSVSSDCLLFHVTYIYSAQFLNVNASRTEVFRTISRG